MKTLQKEACFTIKRFTKANGEFNEALNIYRDEMETSLKTDTNEISFFVEELASKDTLREMYFLGLYYNNYIIGFSEIAFLKKTKTLMIDYFVIKKNFQKNGIFFSLFNLMLGFFHEIRLDYNYLIIEASKKAYLTSITQKMLFYEDFKIVETLYYQPQLGVTNIESLIECDLMLYTKEDISKLKRETYILMVEDIYYNHYIDWYKHFLSHDSMIAYLKQINDLISKIKSHNHTKPEVDLTLEKAIQCNYYKHNECYYGRTSGYIHVPKKKSLLIPVTLLLNIVLTAVFSYIAYILMKKFEIDEKIFFPLLTVFCTIITTTSNYYLKK